MLELQCRQPLGVAAQRFEKVKAAPRELYFSAKTPPSRKERPKPQKNLWVQVLSTLGIFLGMVTTTTGVVMTGLGGLTRADTRQYKSSTRTEVPVNVEAWKNRILNSPKIHFRYFDVDRNKNTFVETEANEHFKMAREFMAQRLASSLAHRPDLLKAIVEEPIDIRLYHSWSFSVPVSGSVIGLYNHFGQIDFATDPLISNSRALFPSSDLIMHEWTHRLDHLDEFGHPTTFVSDGYLPGWTDAEIKRFEHARARELQSIKNHTSPLSDYAATNNAEFLAVLVETYLTMPHALKNANPDLYELVDVFFHEQREFNRVPSKGAIILLGGVTLILISGNSATVVKSRKKSRQES